MNVPISGGNYFRQLPEWFIRRAVARWEQRYSAPLVIYFHVWELDPEQPRISAAGPLTRLRHYRNLHRMEQILAGFFQRLRFEPVARQLGLEATPQAAAPALSAGPRVPAPVASAAPQGEAARPAVPVTIVIPCFNEEVVAALLAEHAAERRAVAGGQV